MPPLAGFPLHTCLYMNYLRHETSPYLLQHADNPVHWHAWKPAAFRKAREEDKPILVSIGYSTCHWCHVMERESFEDEATADFMNAHFVNIKVDREERPDVDQIYMEACQAINGSGGWPLNVFLTPDGRPFYAGTYYPPQPMGNRPSWGQVLRRMVQVYRNQREVVEDQANRLLELIASSDEVFFQSAIETGKAQNAFDEGFAERIFQRLYGQRDGQYGGFGGAPKFPSTMSLGYLLAYHYFTGEADALDHVHFSLQKMIRGGIYDQLGGGFARYATDRAWLVPHFEKMLYDNALLVRLLADVHRADPMPIYRDTITQTLEFVARELTAAGGGFFSALDADSEGEEGKFYIWSWEELQRLLGEELDWVAPFYGLKPEGNWEGQNILWRPQAKADFARDRGWSPEQLAQKLEAVHAALLAARDQRVRPGLDDKILLGWNALMVTAYARAAKALQNQDYADTAAGQLAFLLETFSPRQPGQLLHTYKAGQAQYPAFLDDYAFLIEALLEVYELRGQMHWLERARSLTEETLDRFLDAESGLFFYTSKAQTDLPTRKRELYDSAVPSGNSTMVHLLYKLSILLDQPDWAQRADRMLERLGQSLEKYPSSFSNWALAGMLRAYGWQEVALLGPEAVARAMPLQRHYLPDLVLMASAEATDDYPLLRGKGVAGDTKYFVCKDYACQLPVSEEAEALEQLRRRSAQAKSQNNHS